MKMATTLSRTLTRGKTLAYRPVFRFPHPSAATFASSASIAAASSSSVSETQQFSSSPSQDSQEGSKWSRFVLFLPGAITFGLGTWQIFRRQEKIKMLEHRKQRLEMEPMKLNNEYPSGGSLDSLEFRKVVCKGVFDEGRSIYVGPRSRTISGVTENGYFVITPLMPIPDNPDSVQSPVLVNRGWVPRSWRDKSLEPSDDKKEEPPSTETVNLQPIEQNPWWKFWSKKPEIDEVRTPTITAVEVTGVIRGSEKPSIFVPANDTSSSQWFYVDVPAIARAAGLPENTVYIEDINENVNPSNPYPVPKDVNTLIRSSVMPQDHLNYTLTWYSLSAAVTFMAYKRLKPKGGRR